MFGRTTLASILGIVPGFVVLLLEKNSRLVRSHAGQAFSLNGCIAIIKLITSFISSMSEVTS